MFCTEARATPEVSDSELSIEGYNVIRSDSTSRSSGGVVIYYRKNMKVVKRSEDVLGYDNMLAVEVLSPHCRGNWVGVYHSPNASHAEFLDRLELFLDNLVVLSQPLCVTGDFNINMHANAPNATYSSRLNRMARELALKQLVKPYTRVTMTSRTTVDLLFTNNHLISVSVSDDDIIADHKMLIISKKNEIREYHTKTITDRSQLTLQNFRPLLEAKLASLEQATDFESRAQDLVRAIDSTATSLVKDKQINVAYAKKWYTNELRELRNHRNEASRRAELVNDPPSWTEYRRLRNEYNRAMRVSKNDDLRSTIIECGSDQKKLWRHLKALINQRDAPLSCVIFNGQQVTNHAEIADRLNSFFIDSVLAIKSTIPPAPYRNDMPELEIAPWLSFGMINEAMARRVLKNFKSKSGINNMNKEVAGFALDTCTDRIVDLINDSLDLGTFPRCLKKTVVVPKPKVKGTTDPNQLRPINMCHTIDKIIETLVKEQLDDHLRGNQLISEYQSAYREKHSCETALNLVLNSWIMKRNQKQTIVAVFLDLSRAFETVDREILLDVLRRNRVGGTVLRWFESWLTDRQQVTRLGEVESNPAPVDTGVPQGTPLSTVLFNLYLNSIIHW